MGFTIDEYKLLGVPLQNVYVSIKARYYIMNNNFMYGIQNKYQISSDYWFSVSPNSPTVEFGNVIINMDILPADIYYTIYEKIKSQIDPKYGTPEATLVFTDDAYEPYITEETSPIGATGAIAPTDSTPTTTIAETTTTTIAETTTTTIAESTTTTIAESTTTTVPETTTTTVPESSTTTIAESTTTTVPETTTTTVPETTTTTVPESSTTTVPESTTTTVPESSTTVSSSE